MKALHRRGGMLLLVFVAAHLSVQLLAFFDLAWHARATALLREVYRQPVGTILLAALLVSQVSSGLLHWRRKTTDALGRWQRYSGLALVAFLLIHASAVHYARLQGMETNFQFAAAGFGTVAGSLFFAPYYFIGVLAVFVHVAIAWVRIRQHQGHAARLRVRALTVVGAALGMLLVVTLAVAGGA